MRKKAPLLRSFFSSHLSCQILTHCPFTFLQYVSRIYWITALLAALVWGKLPCVSLILEFFLSRLGSWQLRMQDGCCSNFSPPPDPRKQPPSSLSFFLSPSSPPAARVGGGGAIPPPRPGRGVLCWTCSVRATPWEPRHRSERELISSRGSLLHFPSDAAVVESENYSVTSFSSFVASEVTVRGRGNERSWGSL